MHSSDDKEKLFEPTKDPFCLNLSVVARTLIRLERSVLWIGIPILPNLKTKIDPDIQFFYPIGDFIRATLVTVPTKDLISARNALASRAEDSQESEYFLAILRRLSTLDYLYFPLLSCFSIFILTITSIFPFSYDLRTLLTISIISSIGGILGSLLFYLEALRFFSFIKILDSEILRRSGKRPNKNITPIPNIAFSRAKQ